jgi:excinuclease ABC subunit C
MKVISPLLQSKIDLLPDRPGSYQMKDKNGTVIYVGKAKSLVKRVKQYFTRPQEGKVMKMVEEIEDFDIIETNTEKESLLLEINLIQKYYPKYNILLKDGKMYPYIALRKGNDPFLKLAYNDKDRHYYYFGPFPSSSSARTMVNLMNRIFPLRKCKVLPNKPCLYYYLGQCLAPCVNKVGEDDYKDIVTHMNKLMNGDDSELLSELKAKMKDASEKLDFERAEEYKEQIESVKHIVSSQKIMFEDHLDRDVVGYSVREGYLSLIVFLYRRGILLGKSLYVVQSIGDVSEQIETMLLEFYQKHPLPKELILPLPEIADVLGETLSLDVVVPQRGFKKDLLAMALENAKQGLDQHFQTARLDDDKLSLLEDLQKKLSLEKTPLDIELYDNSHLQGADAVGAMVKFINGEKVPSLYRKYNLRGENTKDDLASMREVLTRRFSHLGDEKEHVPDLIILDGGENQIMAALEVEEQTGVSIPLCGLRKNDRHETDALITDQGEEIPLDRTSSLFFLLMRMQDEVHRFAITTFRSRKVKDFYQTVYDGIPGIGQKRKRALLDAYPTTDSLRSASVEELSQLIPLEAAQMLKKKIEDQDAKDQKLEGVKTK